MKAVCLVSSGIDSPVAAYLVSLYVDEILLLHVDTGHFSTGDHISTFRSLAELIREKVSCRIRTGIVPHADALSAFRDHSELRYTCVFCKRMMVRYADAIALLQGADMIVMGDSLGQVASQTLQNINVVDSVSTVPIIRPLIGFDKQEIVEIAKKVGSFDLSTRDGGKCLAVPSKPSTRARKEILEEIEKNLDISGLVEGAISQVVWKEI
jgi:tRNA uracil 4-sulfurtransferase